MPENLALPSLSSPGPSPTSTSHSSSTIASSTSEHFNYSESSSPNSTATSTAPSSPAASIYFAPKVHLPIAPKSASLQVLDIDKPTPDSHVARDPRLIRLTGVHPFNVEAPLTDLFNQGFITNADLFYVRNHGAVPKVEDHECLDWEFTVDGLVEKPLKLTVRDLINDFENVTYPVTFVCAGNRRKEQNVVRKSRGFSWGPAGLSTSLFTGVTMADIIRKANPSRKAKYVCMEGADLLPNGYYGTCTKMNWVMDPNRGIMLAYKQNGEMLTPDHGKPLRAVIPGQIGGRSVKWLTKLIVTDAPSDNWYHLYDNRVLPTMVSPQMSDQNKDWWKDERYAIYELSVNSAIASPAHDEVLRLKDARKTYTLRGYAYAGGGRRVTRVEVSLDRGVTWRLADIDYPEDRFRDAGEMQLHGGSLDVGWRETSFCWCFWELDVGVEELAAEGTKDIVLRCGDESLALQPRDMYWSVLGMMNNPWFRVVIHKEGENLRFEHPTQPALMPGGWMERVKKDGGDIVDGFWGEGQQLEDEKKVEVAKPEIKLTKDGVDRIIGLEELQEHDKAENPWFVVNGHVFDGVPFLKDHPGGAQSIISAAGLDATEEFMAIHSETAKEMMPDYHLGSLDEISKRMLAESAQQSIKSDGPRPLFLDNRAWTKAVLYSKRIVSWDSRVFTFKLEHDDQEFGLPTGQHAMMRLKCLETKEPIIRSYTPISETSAKGFLDVLVKIYFDTDSQKGGRMTKAMEAMKLGDIMEFKGPIGKFQYLGRGSCSLNGTVRMVKNLYMICGGSGVTPIYQVFRAVMQDKQDPTKCVVLDGNRLEEDILCRDDMEKLAKGNNHKCQLLLTLSKASDTWTGLRGRIGKELITQHIKKTDQAMVLICGPEAMEKSAHSILNEQGWDDSDILHF